VSPLVSICIPTYNGARWLKETLLSALAQTYEPLEIMVVDDASTDHTLEVVGSFSDSRIHVEVNECNLGLVRNWNRCVKLSKGSLVKFVFQDDLLYPTCVEKMVHLFEDNQRVGIVFALRDILLENTDDPRAVAWKKKYALLHTKFTQLAQTNRGIDLFNQWLANGFQDNWVGEPSSVMLRKASLEKIGFFNTKMGQQVDMEMWMRMMYFYDVGFLNEPLSAFRFHSASETSLNRLSNLLWLERMWLVEGLLCHAEIRRSLPQIKRMRHQEAKRIVKEQIGRIIRRYPMPAACMVRSFADYLHYLLLASICRAPSIHEKGSLRTVPC
jgi:glycosyltransferase involved in cell wall biosynthesis